MSSSCPRFTFLILKVPDMVTNNSLLQYNGTNNLLEKFEQGLECIFFQAEHFLENSVQSIL